MVKLIVVNETLSRAGERDFRKQCRVGHTAHYVSQSDAPRVMRNLHVIRIIMAKDTSKLVRGHYHGL